MPDRGYIALDRSRATFVRETLGAKVFALDTLLQLSAAWEPTRIMTQYGPTTLAAGQALVSSRKLADDLEQSEATIRRGLKKLTSAGLIRCDALVTHPTNEKRRTSKTHPPTVVTVLQSALTGERAQPMTHQRDADATHRRSESDAEEERRREEAGERESEISDDVRRVMAVSPEISAVAAGEWLAIHEGDADHLVSNLRPFADKRLGFLDRIARDPKRRKFTTQSPERRPDDNVFRNHFGGV